MKLEFVLAGEENDIENSVEAIGKKYGYPLNTERYIKDRKKPSLRTEPTNFSALEGLIKTSGGDE